MGLVSLFADMTYEGARSIAGPFLAILGAGGTAVGLVAGTGELVGYGLRLVSGYLADRTGRPWMITIIGYAVNLAAVPLLALAGRWEWAAGLMIAERIGKAIRTPARDAMLSHATHQIGRGWGFGLHEAMDQIGAVLGPLGMAAVIYFQKGYSFGFAILAIPAGLALSTLLVARIRYPRPSELEPASAPELTGAQVFPRPSGGTWGPSAFVAAGFADFPLIAYHLKRTAIDLRCGDSPLVRVGDGRGCGRGFVAGDFVRPPRAFACWWGSPSFRRCLPRWCFFRAWRESSPGLRSGEWEWEPRNRLPAPPSPSMVPKDRRGSAYGAVQLVLSASPGSQAAR